MALNFSHWPIFPSHLSEDSLVSSRISSGYLVDGIAERNADEFGRGSWHSHPAVHDYFDYGRDRWERGGLQDSVPNDILDLLPSDPFGMDISTISTAITGWLDDLEDDCCGYGRDGGVVGDENCQLFARLNYILKNAMKFQDFSGSMPFVLKSVVVGGYDMCLEEGDVSFHGGVTHGPDCSMDELQNFGSDINSSTYGKQSEECSGVHGGPPHAALHFAKLQEFSWSIPLVHKSTAVCGYDVCVEEKGVGDVSFHTGLTHRSDCSMDEVYNFCSEINSSTSGKQSEECSEAHGGAPHAALSFALSYLSVRDLLVVGGVCRSLRSMVGGDPLLWRSIHIDQPLNEKITDEFLVQLTNKAQGHLQCLSLVECQRITDDGLKRVLENNPRLTKLSVPGCTRLSIDSVVSSLKALKPMRRQGVKQLRIGGLYGVTQRHFNELKVLLGTDLPTQKNAHKPHFYYRGNFYLSCDDDRTIDIETCPRCQNIRLVYDCPAETCQGKKEDRSQICRACTICIRRCIQCGRCINDCEYEETFCLDLLCFDCWSQQEKAQESDVTEAGCPYDEESFLTGEQECGLFRHG